MRMIDEYLSNLNERPPAPSSYADNVANTKKVLNTRISDLTKAATDAEKTSISAFKSGKIGRPELRQRLGKDSDKYKKWILKAKRDAAKKLHHLAKTHRRTMVKSLT